MTPVAVYPRPSLRIYLKGWPQLWNVQGLAYGLMELIGSSLGMPKV